MPKLPNYRVTHLDDHTRYYFCDPADVYDHIWYETGNHEWAAELSSWAELAPIGDNWTCEEIGMDVAILGDED